MSYVGRRDSERVRRAHKRDILDRLKLAVGCADCGYNENAIALEFDHVRGEKFKAIGLMTTYYSLARIFAEIEKCEVVCSNCHQIRTHDRRIGGTVLG